MDKEETDGEKDAMRVYKAAREENDQMDEVAEQDAVSSALIDRVKINTPKNGYLSGIAIHLSCGT